MIVKEYEDKTKYIFTSALYIDNYMNASVDCKQYDRFMMLLQKHNIKESDLEFTRFVDGKAEIIMGVSLKNELHTQSLKYDILTFIMENK